MVAIGHSSDTVCAALAAIVIAVHEERESRDGDGEAVPEAETEDGAWEPD